jgi:nucleoside-diphosphate-sugar epimerase
MRGALTLAEPNDLKPSEDPLARLTGRVVVTGAAGQVGRRLLERLAGSAAETFALARRAEGVRADHVVVASLLTPRALGAIEEADLVVHLAGALRPRNGSYWDANVGSAAVVAHAVRRGMARRVLFVSCVGASLSSRNEYLRTKAEAERLLAGSGRELVVFRATHIVGTPRAPGPTAQAFLARGDRPVLVPGDGRQLVAPILLDDVVSALLAALTRGSPGTYDLAGPDTMSLNDFVSMLNGGLARVRHVPARLARLAARFLPSLPAAAVEVMLEDSVGDPARAVAAFGLDLHPLSEQWSWPWI